ncbi:sulfite exporter TauE/SafE family protein [Olivibacter sp. SDN3]|uniref:sulfite exporter TauE/SafE family protein n=1 Tax=unclassified Olivibacter TaxID=2632301 RepID=UPI001650E303|nr:sulfite exporter TauE/SafE family protein [Olivibacter sp. SDN3]QNL50274.1 sulfite exporter TauE/SafE family protein [Olivibacter sp. SDN3]
MELLIIGICSLLVSLLTFFSGFGLGTILMPIFAIFFPVDIAIALTGVVHLLNNVFKFFLTGKQADKATLFRFGIPAIIGAFIGAYLLLRIAHQQPLLSYAIGSRTFHITSVKMIISVLLIVFALMEVLPRFKRLQFGKDKMMIGGLISGFFGGLSGNQGALRSAFLIKAGLSKESFVATGVIIACLVDLSRLSVYFRQYLSSGIHENLPLLMVATLAAFIGAFSGNLLLKKITLPFIQKMVTFMIVLLAVALGLGLI